jgi:sRNA-binding regulator protein Hfq
MKVQIKKDAKAYNKFKVNMELTEGAILALKHALEQYAQRSPVAADLLDFVKVEGESAGIKWE